MVNLETKAEEFLEVHAKGGVFGLSGGLGAGKTTFVRSVIEVICKRSGLPFPRVISPTYVFHQSYAHLIPPVEHFDLYRFEAATSEELAELGYFERVTYVLENGGFLFVEWPEKVAHLSDLLLTHRLNFALP